MSKHTWWFLYHNTTSPTEEQRASNAEMVSLANDIYRLEAELSRKRKRLSEVTGKKQ
jgi:hypothetical protein